MVLRHLYFGPGPCNFRRILISHFLESVFEGKGLLGLDSATTSMAGRNPTFSPLNTPHSRPHRLGFCLDIKLAIVATSPRLERRRGLLYFAPIQDPTSFNKAFLLIRNILIAILVLTCSRFQVGIKTLAGQADRVHAGSVTSRRLA